VTVTIGGATSNLTIVENDGTGVSFDGSTTTLTVVDHAGAQVSVDGVALGVALTTSTPSITIDLFGVQGAQGPAGPASPALEDLTFTYSGSDLASVTGETYTRTLTYDSDGKVTTVADSDTGIVQTIAYDPLTGRPTSRTLS